MEGDNKSPSEIKSVDCDKELLTSIVYLNKKRKFQAELLDLPLSKHRCWDQSLSPGHGHLSITNPEAEDFFKCILKGKIDLETMDDELEVGSAKDSNSFLGDTGISISVSGEAKDDFECLNTFLHDGPSASAVNWGEGCSKPTVYSLDSQSVTKISAEREQQSHVEKGHSACHNDFGLHPSLNFEEHLLEFGNPIDYNFSDYKDDSIEQCTDKELDNMFYSSEVNPNNYVLSSGRWNINQGTQPESQKLTIDKEFEHYFSMLML